MCHIYYAADSAYMTHCFSLIEGFVLKFILSCLYKNLFVCPFFAYKYLRINFYPLVCCYMKPFMRARRSRRHMVEYPDEIGNFCCSKTGLLIAESGKNVHWNLQLGP